ncbi:MAG: hypothetical protein KY410_10660, partial [Proteobacteria bacterium]|nr:hypothetical protein [Pseudomonadota bacterium]
MDIGGDELVAALRGAPDERCSDSRVLHVAVQLLVAVPPSSTSDGLEELAAAIPAAFFVSGQPRARIRVGDSVFGCERFPEDVPVLSAGFKGPDNTSGSVDVVYQPAPGDRGAPRFLDEEKALLASLARLLELHFRRVDADRAEAVQGSPGGEPVELRLQLRERVTDRVGREPAHPERSAERRGAEEALSGERRPEERLELGRQTVD